MKCGRREVRSWQDRLVIVDEEGLTRRAGGIRVLAIGGGWRTGLGRDH